MQIPGLEVRLRSGKRRDHPAQVRQGRHVVGSIQKLRDARAPTNPVARGQGMNHPLSQDIRPHRGHHIQLPVPHAGPLQLIFYISGETVEGHAEEILHQIPGELQPLIGIVVLVVLAPACQRQLKAGLRHAGEKQGFSIAILFRHADMGKQISVQDIGRPLLLVLLGLARGHARAYLLQSLLGGRDLGLLQVLQHELDDLRVVGYGFNNIHICFHAQRSKQCHEVQTPGDGGKRDLQDRPPATLHDDQRSVTLPLAEYLGHLDVLIVALVVLH
ncbi:Uncharacterised protein [uncultured archaeon]|nr:Uncharacterised protein [uncultured archaeon]